jgi:hypothetical protein
MCSKRLTSRTIRAGAWAVSISLCAAAGHGEAKRPKDKRACKAAYKSAQEREQAGKLREAKELLSTCANVTCGGVLKKECASRSAHLDAEIPSIVPVVTDDARLDVQIRMDGELLMSHLDGRAVPIDPGTHEFTFSTERGVVATQTATVDRGQHARPIAVALHASTGRASTTKVKPSSTVSTDSPPPRVRVTGPAAEESSAQETAPAMVQGSSKSGPPALAYVLGGVGGLGVAGGILMNAWGRKDNRDLLASCAPNCSQSSVDHVRRVYFAADLSIGVGVAALGVATVLFFTSNRAKERPGTVAAYTVDVKPAPSGAFATVSGMF